MGRWRFGLILLIFMVELHLEPMAQTYVFARLSGSPVNTAGWNLQGGARVTNITGTGNSELLVCGANDASGAVFYNQPINLSLCSRWKAEFDFRLYDGTGADGLAFCFLDVPPSGFVSGGGLGIPGTANGLKICFDTWNNCIPFNPSTVHDSMPKVEIRWGQGYNECAATPTKANVSGNLTYMRSPDYHHCRIEYDNGNISVFVEDTLYLTGFQTFNFSGYLGFTASTGGYSDNHSIKNVIIYTEMPPSLAGPPQGVQACPNNPVSLGTVNNSLYAYSWYPAAGLNNASLSNPVLKLDNLSAGQESHYYYVRTAYASNPGCFSTDSVLVTIYPRPKVNFSMPGICLKDATASFTDSSYSNDPSAYPFAYSWQFGDPNASPPNPDTSGIPDPSHSYSATGNYTVSLKVTSNEACVDSLSKIFTVNGDVPRADFIIANTGNVCVSNEVIITNNSSVNFGKITRIEIFWDLAGNPSSLETDASTFSGKVYRHRYPYFYGATPQTFTVRIRAYSGISCVDEVQKDILVYPLPQPIFPQPPAVCRDVAPFLIQGAGDAAGNNGQGIFRGPGIDPTGLFNPLNAQIGINHLVYTFTTTAGCIDSALADITVWPLPTLQTDPALYVLEGGTALMPAKASGQGLEFKWTPPEFLSSDTVLQPRVTPLRDMLYTIRVTGLGGCASTSQVQVKLLYKPVVPNAFSPNGDGINDFWQIKYLDTYPGATVQVFNRYGQLVFESDGYNRPWDGTYRGQPLPVGTYYWIINPKNGRSQMSGSVTIIR